MWGFRPSTLANLSFRLLFAINFSVSHLSASKHFQNETDCLALLEFKNQIYDDPFEVLNSWNHSQHHCEWEGHLSGTISPHVGNLSFMRFIHLEENQFRGEIPQEFGHLFRLRVLNLSGNALSGKIPANLSYCSEMTAFSLMSNRLEGKIPINQLSNLKKLELLNIYSNNLTGEISSSIGNLPSLITVVLSFNNLGGYLPKEMRLLKKLAILRLGGNKLSGFTLPNLVVLAVGENKFYGNLPASITNASGLVTLDLSRNNFQGQVPANLGDLTNLQIINFSINLFGNNCTGDLDFVASLTNCSNLTSLSLSGNNFGGKFPKVMANLSNQLTKLYMGGNQQSGIIPEGFGNLTHSSLMHLMFGEDSFSGFLPREVGKLIHLVDLDVSQNQLAGGIPISLADCTNLENLYMQSNFFQGTIPPNLASLKSIQQLDLSSNNLTGSIPKELEKLQYLRYLNLSYNDIEGEVPNTDFQQCKSNIIDWQQQTLWRHSGIGVPTLPTRQRTQHPRFESRRGSASLKGESQNYQAVEDGKNRGKLKVIILPSIVLPATFLVLGAVLLYLLVYRIRERRLVARFSSMPTRIDELLRLSYHELLRSTSGFSPENLIGSGNFGAVYKGILEKLGNKLVAVKVVLDLQKNGASKSFKAECKTLRNIRHRNLISILSHCSNIDSKGDEFKALVYEFMENGNLDLWLHPETTDQATSCRITFFAHVGDFGLARLLPKPINRSSELGTGSTIAIKGSIGYADPPKYGMGVAASTLGDVYGYGILLLEMITRKRPIDDMFVDELDLHNYVNRALLGQVYEIMECVISLVKIGLKCSEKSPNDRMHMNEVVGKLHHIKDVFLGVSAYPKNLEA
ncbi:unnamed protein product [Coffea canephora]|uniref:Protein kinase domain-containing protein n=1 Tax=Coffea canephora TaxID=49390 RepID=A0A068V9D6_COFCA|nr:unnamed protein product [Coffea canephora]